MNREELDLLLEDHFESNFKIKTDSNGQLVIYTGLIEDEDGELVSLTDNDLDENDDEDDEDSNTFYTPSNDYEEDHESDDSDDSEKELDFDD